MEMGGLRRVTEAAEWVSIDEAVATAPDWQHQAFTAFRGGIGESTYLRRTGKVKSFALYLTEIFEKPFAIANADGVFIYMNNKKIPAHELFGGKGWLTRPMADDELEQLRLEAVTKLNALDGRSENELADYEPDQREDTDRYESPKPRLKDPRVPGIDF